MLNPCSARCSAQRQILAAASALPVSQRLRISDESKGTKCTMRQGTQGEVSEIWNHFFKFNFFYVIFFAETSLGYLGTSPGSVGMVSWPQKGAIPGVQSFLLDRSSDFMHFLKSLKGPSRHSFQPTCKCHTNLERFLYIDLWILKLFDLRGH